MEIRSFLTMLCFVTGLVLCGCDAQSDSAAKKSGAIVGMWNCHDGRVTTTYEFRADGTCTKTQTVGAQGLIPEMETGTWRLPTESQLELCFSTETVAPPVEDHLIQLNGDKLAFLDSEHPLKFQRMR